MLPFLCSELYCASCNRDFHKASKFSKHVRELIGKKPTPAASAPAATDPDADGGKPELSRMNSDVYNSFNDDVLMCSNCEDEPATSMVV